MVSDIPGNNAQIMGSNAAINLVILQNTAEAHSQWMLLNKMKIQTLQTVKTRYLLEPSPGKPRSQGMSVTRRNKSQNLTVEFKVDTGSQENILSQSVYNYQIEPLTTLDQNSDKID